LRPVGPGLLLPGPFGAVAALRPGARFPAAAAAALAVLGQHGQGRHRRDGEGRHSGRDHQ
jgi:hypothetical protein